MKIFCIIYSITCVFILAAIFVIFFISYIADSRKEYKDEKVTTKEPKNAPGIIYTHNYASDIVDIVINTFGEYGLLNDSYYDSESKDSADAASCAYDESTTMVETMISEVSIRSAKGSLVQFHRYSDSGQRYEEFESKNV